MNSHLDTTDAKLLDAICAVREQIPTQRVGDYVLFGTGELERISHDWGDHIQTSPNGSIFLYKNGHGSFSGGLNPAIPTQSLMLSKASLPGSYWFFHHGMPGPGRGVYFDIKCRVYTSSAPYAGFLSATPQVPQDNKLKAELAMQMDALATT